MRSHRSKPPAVRPPRAGARSHRLRARALVALVGVVAVLPAAASAATIVGEYRPGTRQEVLINGYALRSGAGAFALDDGGTLRTCFCVEAHTDHSVRPDAYRRSEARVAGPELDALLFLQRRGVAGVSGDDLAVATQLLGYHYAGAKRRGGGAVWSDYTTGRAVSPTSPIAWDALPALTAAAPVGVRVGGRDRDDLEALVLRLHRLVLANRGPWALAPVVFDRDAGRATAELTGAGGSISMGGVGRWEIVGPDGSVSRTVTADATAGSIAIDEVALPAGGTLRLSVEAPGRHVEFAGTNVQRLACAETQRLARRIDVDPLPASVRIRKAVDDVAAIDGRDLAGFSFDVLGAGDQPVGTVTTGADGLSDPIDVAPGDYVVREVDRPPWAAPLLDDGPHPFTVDAGGTELEWTYVNRVPDAELDTSAADAADGDRVVTLPGTVIDRVAYSGLLPGTRYRATAELHALGASDGPTPTGLRGTTTFEPTASSGTVEVEIEVPDDSALTGSAVVFQTVSLVSDGSVVATHHDPTAADQTVRLERPVASTTSTSTTTTSTSTTVAATTTSTLPPPSPASVASTLTPTTTAPVPTTTPPLPTTVPPPAPRLPRSGGAHVVQGALALALMATGAGLVRWSRRR